MSLELNRLQQASSWCVWQEAVYRVAIGRKPSRRNSLNTTGRYTLLHNAVSYPDLYLGIVRVLGVRDHLELLLVLLNDALKHITVCFGFPLFE
jgi:hypothetical protein